MPYASLPICEMTVGVPLDVRRDVHVASRIDRPRNITPSSEPMITSVVRAFFHAGLRNAGTPFEIASTPVTAAPPDANACSTTHERRAHEETVAAVLAERHHARTRVVVGLREPAVERLEHADADAARPCSR